MNESPLQNLEDIYQLSPMQQGMLFHTLLAPESGAYFEQSLFTVKGELEVKSFERAWQTVVDRHSILRSSFLWEELEHPQQVVHRQVSLPFLADDWSGFTASEQEQRLTSYLKEDRSRGFDLGTAPLLRLALFQVSPTLYRFVFSRHHLLIDRWSRSLLLKEVFALYDTYSRGETLELAAPRAYGDYIAWIENQDPALARTHWEVALRGITAPTAFSVDSKPERSQSSVDYGDQRVFLSEETTERLREFARESKVTLNVVAQAAWALLLSRYSGDDDVVFGVTVSGRPASLEQAEAMIGLFINTLPLRVEVPPGVSVRQWLVKLQDEQSRMQQFEHSSLIDIQSWTEVPRGLPLFESIFVFENLPVAGSHQVKESSVAFSEDRGFGSTTGYPLTILISPGRRLAVQIVYDQTRFSAEATARMLGHYETLLTSMLENSTKRLSAVEMLTAAELNQLREWNSRTASSLFSATQDPTLSQSSNAQTEVYGTSVLDLFDAQVSKTPDTPAILSEDESLSYQQLNERAHQLANYLRGLGVGPDSRVGVCLERGLDLVVSVLAILKAGGAYVPLDPAYPAERLQFMLSDSKCSVLLTNESLSQSLRETSAQLVFLNRDRDQIQQAESDPIDAAVSGNHLAFIIYTSGSTGWPKGVAMPHRALANLINWQIAGRFQPGRTLQFASLSFDVSFQEIFSTWCSGGTLVTVSDEVRRDAPALLKFLIQHRIERIFVPFVYLQHLAEVAESTGTPAVDLREVVTAGEQLEITPQISNFFRRLKNCRLHNHYGPSETHVVTSYSLPQSVAEWPSLPPIGRPIANTQTFIFDRGLRLVPVGVPGELLIGGANVSRGYLDRPDATAEKYVPDPFAGSPGARLYRTGDLARYLADGNIEFLGRIDHQVKVRGFRVELGEIETALVQHPAVREAVVLAREGSAGRELAAYLVVAGEQREQLPPQLRRHLKEKLPDFMIPTAFMVVDRFPLTPSGKIDRKILPAPDRHALVGESIHEPAQTAEEERLIEIWTSVLHREPIGRNDNFFELGGHSLLATQLISRVRQTFEIEIPLRALFDSPTLSEFASAIKRFRNNQPADRPKILKREAEDYAKSLLEKIDELSDEDVEALLNEALAERN
jgi:amino acid adenylation domain-containing protein